MLTVSVDHGDYWQMRYQEQQNGTHVHDQVKCSWLTNCVVILILQEALQHPGAHRLYITHVLKDFDCDVHFPDFDKSVFKEIRLVDYHLHAR